MNLRGTLALLVIAAGLGLWVWLVEIRGEEKRVAAEAAERRLFELDIDSVTKLELPTDVPTRARIVRVGEDWRLEAPVEWSANPATIDSVLEALADFQLDATVEEPGADLSSYGLGDQARRVDVWTGDGEPTTLYLGKETPVGAFRYVALEEQPSKLYTVAEAKTGWLTPTMFNLRDKRIVSFDESQVQGLRVVSQGSLIIAAERVANADPNADAGWQLTAPVQELASATRISGLLSDLNLARAGSLIDEPESDETYGLHRPDLELEIVTASGTEQLVFGSANDDAFLRVVGRPTIFQVPNRLLQSLPRTSMEYRDREVLSLTEADVMRIELEFPRDTHGYVFERDESGWNAVGAELDLKPLKIEDLVYALESLQATGFADEPIDLAKIGLEPPRVRVRAKNASGEELGWLELGDPMPIDGLPARSSRGERVWRVANPLGREVPLGLEAFQNLFLQPAEPDPAAPDTPAGEPAAPDTP